MPRAFEVCLEEDRPIPAAIGMNEPDALNIPPRSTVAIQDEIRFGGAELRMGSRRIAIT
jgi:hypothetical protein